MITIKDIEVEALIFLLIFIPWLIGVIHRGIKDGWPW